MLRTKTIPFKFLSVQSMTTLDPFSSNAQGNHLLTSPFLLPKKKKKKTQEEEGELGGGGERGRGGEREEEEKKKKNKNKIGYSKFLIL